MPDLLEELKRRNVFRVGIAYVVIAWVIAQVAELALDSYAAPDWVMKTLLLSNAKRGQTDYLRSINKSDPNSNFHVPTLHPDGCDFVCIVES